MKKQKNKQTNKKGTVSNDIIYILIAGAVMIALMTVLILWKFL
jgi:hypothetical protein